MQQTGEGPKEGHKDDQGAGECVLCKKTEGVRSFHPRKEAAWGISSRGYNGYGGFLFTKSHMEKTRGNRYNFHQERFHLGIRKKFFTVRTIIHQNNLPRDVVESSSLEVFKTQLYRVLDNLTKLHKRACVEREPAKESQPKRAPLLPEPNCLGASAAAEVPHHTKGQGSPFLLLWVLPAVKEKRAKSCGEEVPSERSWTLSALSLCHLVQGKSVVWKRGAPGAQLPPAAERWGRMYTVGKAAAASVQHKCLPATGGEKGHPAPVFSKLTSQVTKSTFTARRDGRWLLLGTNLQEKRCAHCAAPWQKGPPASCISPWPCVRGGDSQVALLQPATWDMPSRVGQQHGGRLG
ncbi:hypothetical protein QYF61_021685 [Mycteria americana]|uniref:Uncharacterized protein n=1 Tax=Mycteria americana TaxID=33587 RepID=A0AAN7NWU1_MYCAM|nr:hypothetical protein QYF61_021685 [Mycteria americana]